LETTAWKWIRAPNPGNAARSASPQMSFAGAHLGE
jgi:hypothetical protein